MLTEWLIDVPDDLDDMWLAKIAPEGFRVLLIAKQANTSCYSGGGRVITRLKTNFPGGSQELPVNETVLDCIFHSNTNTFFILDCLYWNSMSMLDSDVTFRFYWLKTQFSESPALARCGKYFFVLLDFSQLKGSSFKISCSISWKLRAIIIHMMVLFSITKNHIIHTDTLLWLHGYHHICYQKNYRLTSQQKIC